MRIIKRGDVQRKTVVSVNQGDQENWDTGSPGPAQQLRSQPDSRPNVLGWSNIQCYAPTPRSTYINQTNDMTLEEQAQNGYP